MATLTALQITNTGTDYVSTAADVAGDKVAPGDNVFIQVANGGGGAITVTVNSVRPSDQGTDEDLVVSVAAGAAKRIGPLPANRFASTSDGLVSWTYSGVTTVTVAAVKL